MPKCRLCFHELTPSEKNKEYFRCLMCRVEVPEASEVFIRPTAYAIQFSHGELIKESIALDYFVIDFRPNHEPRTDLGRYVWRPDLGLLNYELILKLPGQVFDLSDIENARRRLKLVLTFQ